MRHCPAYILRKGICIANRYSLLIVIALAGLTGSAQQYNFRNFDAGDGLAQTYIYSILQDTNGYLWVGTGNGLSRYDGFEFRNFTTEDSLADNFIACGIRNGDTLWYGHRNGSLSFYDGKEFLPIREPGGNKAPVTSFARSPGGKIWAGTFTGGFLELERGKNPVVIPWETGHPAVNSFEFINETELLVGTNTGLLYCGLTDSGRIEILARVPEIPGRKVSAVRKMNDGTGYFAVTENNGIYRVYPETERFRVNCLVPDTLSVMTGVQDILEDRESNLWVATFGNGLIKIVPSPDSDSPEIIVLNKVSGFPSNNTKTVFEDREGIVWCGDYGEGLTRITPETFSVITFNSTLYGNNIFSIFCHGSTQWIGTEKGLLVRDLSTGKLLGFYGRGQGLPGDSVTSVFSADGRNVWIGTGRNGLFRMDAVTDKIVKFPISGGALENSITTITGSDETVWIGTKKGLCRIQAATDSIEWYTLSRGGLPHNLINSLYMDNSGRLWLSTRSSTLAYIQNGQVVKIPLQSGFRILALGAVAEDENSRLWIGTRGSGVMILSPDTLIALTEREGLLSNYCYSMILDDRNNIWVGHRNGLSRIRVDDLRVKPIEQIDNPNEAYRFNQNCVAMDVEERLWFGSDRGLIAYDPSLEYKRFLPPVTGITSLRINDEDREVKDKIVLSPGSYKVRIEYLGISLKEPSLVNYTYRLEGYEKMPVTTKSTAVTYNHLSEGEYSFVLNSTSGDGVVTQSPLVLQIIIKTPLWKKWWFYAFIALSLALLTYGYIKRREYKFLEEKRILEEKVLERTAEIEKQKNEIEVQKDLIDEKNTDITSSISYARNIQNAVIPPLELFERLLPENFILSKPRDIVSGDFYWITQKDNKVIFTVADCTGHGVPGAFMSLLGITLLNEIVNVEGITNSDKILTQLSARLVQSLKQGRTKVAAEDGIDMALCVLDPSRKTIQFTGGINDLILFRDGTMQRMKGDYLTIGYNYGKPVRFTAKKIKIRKGDVVYLSSDGYQDQFGGEDDRKYKQANLHATLLKIHRMPMQEQLAFLEADLKSWMGETEQTDDITVMGIRL